MNVDQLPPLSDFSSGPDQWDLIEGLHATIIEAGRYWFRRGSHAVHTWRWPRLEAPELVTHIASAPPRARPWESVSSPGWVKMEFGDRVDDSSLVNFKSDRQTGKPANYGAAQFNLDDRSGSGMTGDALASGSGIAFGGWTRIWIDLQSNDGQIFIVLGLLEGSNGRHGSAVSGQNVIFGGFQIAEPGSSPPESISVAPITHIPGLAAAFRDLIGAKKLELFWRASVPRSFRYPSGGSWPARTEAYCGWNGRPACLGNRFADLSPGRCASC